MLRFFEITQTCKAQCDRFDNPTHYFFVFVEDLKRRFIFCDLLLRIVVVCLLVQLLSTADASTSDVSGLHDKLDRKKKVLLLPDFIYSSEKAVCLEAMLFAQEQ